MSGSNSNFRLKYYNKLELMRAQAEREREQDLQKVEEGLLLQNLLSLPQFAMRRPSRGLEYGATQLYNRAQRVGLAPRGGPITPIETLRENIIGYINNVHGSLKGPAQNAHQEVNTYLDLALEQRYLMDAAEMQKELASFLLMLVTEGFENEDTTGTQMGNFQGKWRGGGF